MKTLKRIWTALLGPTTDERPGKLLRLPRNVSVAVMADHAWVTLHRDDIRGTETHRVVMKRSGGTHILLDLGGLDASSIDPQPSRWREVAADGGPIPDDTSKCDRIIRWWPENAVGNDDLTTLAMSAVLHERVRQIEKEGFDSGHDDEHEDGELAAAAACYANAGWLAMGLARSGRDKSLLNQAADGWPWSDEWWKPSTDPIKNLVRAGALIVAEIERNWRAQLAENGGRMCESGCGPAATIDPEGVPLCQRCAEELAREALGKECEPDAERSPKT